VGFLLTEISALALIRMRVFHTNASHHFSKEDLAFYATISGSLLAASAIYGAANLIVFKGALISFFIIGLATGMFYLFIRQQNYKELLSAILILFISVSAFSSAKNNESVFDYVTVMLDKPRLFSTLGSRSMSEDERFVLNNINCGLFKLETGKGLVPELVSEWNIEDAGRQYRFKIKPGQRDSEGVQIDGRYIIESLKVLIQEAKSMPLNSILASDTRGYSQILGFDECNNKNCHLKGIFGKNDEVVIKLKKRWPGFLELLTRQMAPIVRSKISANNIAIPVGCGPYRVKSYSNKDLELQRNPFFQVPNEHELPQNFRIRFESPEQAYRGFCNGEFNDLLFLVPTKSDLERARCTQSEFLWHETNTAGFWLINLESKKLRQRPQVIAALKESLNAKRFRQTWNISSPKQYSIIPGVFGNYENLGDETPSVQNNVSNKKMAKILNEEVLVRFIDGTPEPQNLLRALKEWQEYSGVKFRIEATPFSDFMLDLTEGKSDVYIYAELADAKLANFLSSFYEATLRSINKDQVENLKAAWNEYQAQESTRAILDLNRLILGTKLYTPLFVFRRPLVFKKGYYIRRHSEIGLAALSILEFRRGLQKP
jgi:ABC-type transport system substrate-binding protein